MSDSRPRRLCLFGARIYIELLWKVERDGVVKERDLRIVWTEHAEGDIVVPTYRSLDNVAVQKMKHQQSPQVAVLDQLAFARADSQIPISRP